MKKVLNYVVCTLALFAGVAMLVSGGLWSLCGVVWCGVLYVSGEIWPRFWRTFWVSNMRILSFFGCL